MSEEELLAKYKALFPDNVEAIVVRKDDYDRLYGDLTIENIKLKQELEMLNDRIKWQNDKIARLSSENVCLEAKIKLYEDGYKLDKENK